MREAESLRGVGCCGCWIAARRKDRGGLGFWALNEMGARAIAEVFTPSRGTRGQGLLVSVGANRC